ncbi:MAG: gamma-glutamyl-gamma-aminobutyrate hydrolase family protein [Fretibacterium sp.]|nr:gamma-glutamyl-gamma-aminobutyrate hydrolase family protein [Fretibacterium sp.]
MTDSSGTQYRPVIGIPGSIMVTNSGITPMGRNFVNDTCVQAVANNGGIPIILPLLPEPDPKAFALCDGLLFPGGADVSPCYYGEEPHEGLGKVDPVLDAFWLSAARFAQEHRLAVLGICRGMQLLNVACGGTLYQDLSERPGSAGHHQREHRHVTVGTARIEPETRLRRILGTDAVPINSLHHQAVKEPGKGLIVSAHAEDGVVEGFESTDGLIVAVQWHPEDLVYPREGLPTGSVPVMNRLFQDLVQRAGGHDRADYGRQDAL